MRIFLVVARCGQMLAASHQLKMYHTSVSRNLNALEKHLETKLLDRRTTGCTLTGDGKIFFAAAERVESEILNAEISVSSAKNSLNGVFRIGVADGFGTYFLSQELRNFLVDHSDLKVQIVPLPANTSSPTREVEIAITVDRPKQSHLYSRKLVDYQLSIYTSGKILKAHGGHITERDLIDMHLVVNSADVYQNHPHDAEATKPLTVSRRFECMDSAGQVEALRSGAGFGILEDYIAAAHPELRVVLPGIRFRRTYWIATHASVRGFPRTQKAVEYIDQRVRAHRYRFRPQLP